MKLIPMPLAGAGGRNVYVNPSQVVCLIDLGDRRTQLVTTGLQGESSISLLLELSPPEAARLLLSGQETPSPRAAAA
ncbi:MAG TPA: hypothetical protein VLI41_07010 [Phenylobacterium sp.]|uniref:hypothetical protein n=1 Tax=Phenylobacterium sp. TaxID=1871053 RepID=UPI002C3AC6C8|nr:hypothetical protein [Phenylobacterium sp.]HSV02941.1 hypothetical protein [Phenylobacterium sp.]